MIFVLNKNQSSNELINPNKPFYELDEQSLTEKMEYEALPAGPLRFCSDKTEIFKSSTSWKVVFPQFKDSYYFLCEKFIKN